jgi:two-component system chemotaxis sensor kinase CheA
MFRAGLSTKDEVTNLSGRGVGMDVVRAGLEQVGGSIDVTSEPGQGTTFRIGVPMSISVMPALVTWCGGERYAIPLADVHEVVQLDGIQAAQAVPAVGARDFELRGRMLALVDLAEHLGLPANPSSRGSVVVVVESSTRRLGLLVDAVADTTETVVKPRPLAVRSIPTYSGVTILPDGHPILVLDIAMLLTSAGSVIEHSEVIDDEEPLGVASSLLVARGIDGRHVAFALSDVRRLERFDTAAIEHGGDREAIQYRDGLLPLLWIDETHSGREASPEPPTDPAIFETVVCESSIGPIGLVVDRIEDIVDDRVTEVLDVEALVVVARLVGSR